MSDMNQSPVTPIIPDHELLRLIGRGSYGEVWLARNIMGTQRAVKIVYRTAFDHARPYEREFAGLQKFEPISRTHPSQLDILHIGRNEPGGYFYYVMELADDASAERGGGDSADSIATACLPHPPYAPKTLRSEVEGRGPLSPAECIELGLSLSTALAHLHKNGLVHRDIKPSNIIYVNSQVKLADIGLVSAVDATRSYVGTVGYAPYEGPGTPQADIYSLGKVLYEAATGRDRQEFPELPTRLSGTAEQQQDFLELNEVLIKACDDDPRRRYQTADQMHEDLLALRSGKSLVRLRTIERRFVWARRLGAGALLLVLLISPAYLYEARQTRRVRKLAADNLTLAQAAKDSAAEARRNELTARESLYAADISLAFQALQAGNLREALDLLHKQIPKPDQPDLRGFEWRYLWQQCQSEDLFSFTGHKDAVESVAFSPDGRRLATASRDKTIKIWDLVSRREVASLTNHAEPLLSVAWSPSGESLVAASERSVWIEDVNAFGAVRILPEAVFKAKFSPDGRFLVAGTSKGLALWDAHTWRVLETLNLTNLIGGDHQAGHEFGLAFSSDSRCVSVAIDEGIKLLSVPDFQELAVLPNSTPRIRPLAFSPDGRTVAAAALGGTAKLWDVGTRQQTKLFSRHSDSIFGLAFSPDGKKLATASADQTVKIWDTTSGELIRTFRGHSEEVWDVAFSSDGKVLASVSKGGAVKIWDALSGPYRAKDVPEVSPLGFDRAGNLVGLTNCIESVENIIPATNGIFVTLDPESLRAVSASKFNGRPQTRASIIGYLPFGSMSDDGRIAYIPMQSSDPNPAPSSRGDAAEKSWLELWNCEQGRFLYSFDMLEWGSPFVFAPKSALLFLSTIGGNVSIWRFPGPAQVCVVTNAGEVAGCSPDGRTLATAKTDGEVKLWIVNGNAATECATIKSGSWSVEFSGDGALMATFTGDGVIHLWAVPSGRLMANLTGHTRSGLGLCFSLDSRTLASESAEEGIVRLWHVGTSRELLKLPLPAGEVLYSASRFSPDGRTLAAFTGTEKHPFTRLWFAPSMAEIAVAEGRDYRAEMGQDPAIWLATGKALRNHHLEAEALDVFTGLIALCGDQPQLQPLRATALKHRAELLVQKGSFAEAGADNCAALSIPAREPGLSPAFIDLSADFNRSLDRDLYDTVPVRAAFPTLPRGRQTLAGCPGVEFDLRGAVRLDCKDDWANFPKAVEGIHVQQKCRRLLFLQSATVREAEDTLVASYIVHYADAKAAQIPICYGQHVRDWSVPADPGALLDAKVAWTGKGPEGDPIRIFVQTWENPRPEVEIQSLDFVSKLTKCAPFLLAITAE